MANNGSLNSVTGSKNALYVDDIKFQDGSWWERRSSLEKKLVVVLVLLLLLAIALVIVLVVMTNKEKGDMSQMQTQAPPKPETEQEICTTPTCIQTAAHLLENADFTADPCTDFYQYACGAFMEKNLIDEDKSTYDIFTFLDEKLNVKLKGLIEAPSEDSEPTAVTTAKDLYQSCLDLETIDSRGASPLLESLTEFGGWPVLNPNWNETSFDLEGMLIQVYGDNQAPIIHLGVYGDMENSSVYRIYFDQPRFGMASRDYFLKERNDTALMAYQNYITSIALALGADPDTAKAEVEEMVDFEIKIANISVPAWQRYDQAALYNVRNLTQMSQWYPEFNWLRYTKSVMSAEGVDVDIDEGEEVVNRSPPYFDELFPILSETPKKVQANYILWRLVQQRVKLLNSTFRDLLQEYNEVITGIETVPPRWKTCLSYVNSVMRMSTARMYTDVYFDETAKSRMLELISYLRDSFNELLADADWMDDDTRGVAREKANVMKEKIGYPDYVKNTTLLNEIYKNYLFSNDSFFENVVLRHRLSSSNSLKILRNTVDRSRWLVAPVIVNAFYYGSWNEIVFPAGILQPPFYDENQPWSVNFGGIGSVIGHEITHGFDNRGRQRDKDGNLREWWADDVIERFNNETQCFIDQTSNYTWPEAGMKVNGKLTVGEDVADNGGVKQSFRAYRKWVEKQGKEEPLLPGLSLNNNQLFFLSWAQVWCAKIRPETAVMYIYLDYHSPNRYRAFAPFMNLPEFAEAFNCPVESPMNPTEKCAVW